MSLISFSCFSSIYLFFPFYSSFLDLSMAITLFTLPFLPSPPPFSFSIKPSCHPSFCYTSLFCMSFFPLYSTFPDLSMSVTFFTLLFLSIPLPFSTFHQASTHHSSLYFTSPLYISSFAFVFPFPIFPC